MTKLFVGIALLGLGFALALALGFKQGGPRLTQVPGERSLADLTAAPGGVVDSAPVETLNLMCAQGFSTEIANSGQCLATLQSWAERVRSETDRHRYRFRQNPAEFENSEGFFCMLMLAVVLAEDFGIHYAPQFTNATGASPPGDGFFAHPENVFLHGLLGLARQGTCSSMPVLYFAIGRRLGYPLKLVTTKGHLFVRWEGNGERFNLEATSRGLSRFPDDYYRHWPFEITPAEEPAEGYLKSLTPAEEFAVFLSIRGLCLKEQGRIAEAAQAFAAAARFAPACSSYRRMQQALESRPLANAAHQQLTSANSPPKSL